MTENKTVLTRVIAVALVSFGIFLGVSWGSAKFCIGDQIFHAVGLPVWSNGTSGAHYPAILGSVFLLAGIGTFNFTLQEKSRRLIGTVVLLVVLVLSFVFV
ncbi:MAG: hypothetical protein E7445_10040 [Ruminococcaceae bacterium]|nr:hypothetical protein [Oscillospiraceae bacterium]